MRLRRLTLVAAVSALVVTSLAVGGAELVGIRDEPTAEAACAISSTQRYGSRGPQVRCVQRTLGAHGVDAGPVDGIFGRRTQRGVITYQRRAGLSVDGVVGPRTARSLGIWRPSSATATCAPVRKVPDRARTVVDVRSSGSWATVQLMKRTDAGWRCVGAEMAGRVGRNGTRALWRRVGGDGTTPRGVYRLGRTRTPEGDVFRFFGNEADPGVRGRWHQVQPRDCWWVDPGTPAYNRLVRRSRARCTGENEYLPDYHGSYSRAALIGANMGRRRQGDEPGETPRAAAIFLHRHSYDWNGATRPTSGCVSLAGSDLDFVLRRLPLRGTFFVIT
jgi:L,D-peptidoglycan transpeptidase YkuD (ErfK/YbiS/YcfS/YnhG family)